MSNNTQSIEDWCRMRELLTLSLFDALHHNDETTVANVRQQLKDHGCN